MSNARVLSHLGNGPAFSAYNTGTQSLTNGVYAKITLDSEDFDTNNCFATSRFTPTRAGYYKIDGLFYGTGTSTSTLVGAVYKNGSLYQVGSFWAANGTTNGISTVSTLLYLNGSTDYVELYGVVYGTTPSVVVGCRLSGFLARGS